MHTYTLSQKHILTHTNTYLGILPSLISLYLVTFQIFFFCLISFSFFYIFAILYFNRNLINPNRNNKGLFSSLVLSKERGGEGLGLGPWLRLDVG